MINLEKRLTSVSGDDKRLDSEVAISMPIADSLGDKGLCWVCNSISPYVCSCPGVGDKQRQTLKKSIMTWQRVRSAKRDRLECLFLA